jgi:hypothetical protein
MYYAIDSRRARDRVDSRGGEAKVHCEKQDISGTCSRSIKKSVFCGSYNVTRTTSPTIQRTITSIPLTDVPGETPASMLDPLRTLEGIGIYIASGAVIILIVAVLFCWTLRRRRYKNNDSDENMDVRNKKGYTHKLYDIYPKEKKPQVQGKACVPVQCPYTNIESGASDDMLLYRKEIARQFEQRESFNRGVGSESSSATSSFLEDCPTTRSTESSSVEF